MNILLVAGIWLAIAALASLLIGAGATVGSRRPARPLPPPRRRPSPGYRQLSIFDWTAAANADATRALLAARLPAVRRALDASPELDG